MSIFAKCMENDADHNVGRMKLDHGPTQVAPPWFLVTRAAVLRHGAICDCLVTFHASIRTMHETDHTCTPHASRPIASAASAAS